MNERVLQHLHSDVRLEDLVEQGIQKITKSNKSKSREETPRDRDHFSNQRCSLRSWRFFRTYRQLKRKRLSYKPDSIGSILSIMVLIGVLVAVIVIFFLWGKSSYTTYIANYLKRVRKLKLSKATRELTMNADGKRKHPSLKD